MGNSIYIFSEAQKQVIEEAQEQYKNGNFKTAEEVDKEIDE